MIGLGALELTFAGVSTVFAMVSVWGQFRRVDEFRASRAALRAIVKRAGLHPRDDVPGEEDLFQFLSDAQAIIQPLKKRVIARLILVLFIIVGGAALVPADFTGQPVGPVKGMDLLDPLIFVLQVVAAAAMKYNWLLKGSEQRFLEKFAALEAYFYERYVTEAIGAFNIAFSGSALNKLATRELEREEDRLRRLIREEFSRPKLTESPTLLGETSASATEAAAAGGSEAQGPTV